MGLYGAKIAEPNPIDIGRDIIRNSQLPIGLNEINEYTELGILDLGFGETRGPALHACLLYTDEERTIRPVISRDPYNFDNLTRIGQVVTMQREAPCSRVVLANVADRYQETDFTRQALFSGLLLGRLSKVDLNRIRVCLDDHILRIERDGENINVFSTCDGKTISFDMQNPPMELFGGLFLPSGIY